MNVQSLHKGILKTLIKRYDCPLMNNVYRSDWVECMVSAALGPDWSLTWELGQHWAGWDLEHRSGARLEVKQSAAKQPWNQTVSSRSRSPRFDIAPRSGYWTEGGGRWVEAPGRLADLYFFGWHPETRDGIADHRDPDQWVFYVVAERDLQEDQKSIGLTGLRSIGSECRISDLRSVVDLACPTLEEFKAALEGR